jgi:hypothetical protein
MPRNIEIKAHAPDLQELSPTAAPDSLRELLTIAYGRLGRVGRSGGGRADAAPAHRSEAADQRRLY